MRRVGFVSGCVIICITLGLWLEYGDQGVFRPPAIYTPFKSDRDSGAVKKNKNLPIGSQPFDVDLSRTYYLTSKEALMDKPLTDYLLAANATTSTAKIIVQDANHRVGDRVYMKVILNNGYGHPIKTGGDNIRARMYEDSAGASIAGHVTDYGNGTHLVTFVSMWAGTPKIGVYLQYTRATLRAVFYAHEPAAYSNGLAAMFRNNKASEESVCHPDVSALLKNRSYSMGDLCNLTTAYTGMQLYCMAPKNQQFRCDDWYGTIMKDSIRNIDIFGATEKYLIKSSGARIGALLNVTIIPRKLGSVRDMLPVCSAASPRQLWDQAYPVGYFYNHLWNPQHCRLVTPRQYGECLQGKTLILLGDSTTRQWFKELMSNSNMSCDLITGKWTEVKWYKLSICVERTLNFTMQWAPHAFLYGRGTISVKDHKSIPMYIDEVRDNDDVIVLIHLFLHSLRFREDIFRTRMVVIRQSVERLLLRNPKAVVAIKGPHAYPYVYGLEDYYGYLYRDIIYDVFVGLHGRVIYLDYMEMCISAGVKDRHPPKYFVKEMVRHLIGFTCRSNNRP